MNFGDERIPKRVWNKIQIDADGHWLWTGAFSGVPQTRITVAHRESRVISVRRWLFETAFAPTARPVAVGGCLLTCVNPDHVRGFDHAGGPRAAQAAKSRPNHCPRGHEYTEENVYSYEERRICKTCTRTRHNDGQRKRRLAQLSTMQPARRQQAVRRSMRVAKSWETRRARYGESGMKER